ncbi:MAG: hypothetical protein ACR2OJ_09270 [Hyphomicrobiales bacterium]
MPTILTWNMQGGQGNNESKWQNLSGCVQNPAHCGLTNRPAVICLQECSDVPNMDVGIAGWGGGPGGNVTVGSKNFGTYNNPLCFFVAHYLWGNANNRVSFAILIHTVNNPAPPPAHKQYANDLSAHVAVLGPVALPGTQPVIGVTLNLAALGAPALLVSYYSMHAPSGVSVNASRAYVNDMITAAGGGGPGWPNHYIIGGDFNCEPADLHTIANPIPNGALFHTGLPTCGDKNYDYFTADNQIAAQTVLNNVSRIPNLMSDHIAVAADY